MVGRSLLPQRLVSWTNAGQLRTKAMYKCLTISRAGGFATFLGGGGASSSGGGDAAFGGGFAATFFFGAAAGAAAGGGLGGPPPALHFTVAFSKASLTFAFLTSAIPSITGLRGRSPTIFIRVPQHIAASSRAPAKLSSIKVARVSARGLICAVWMGVVAVDKERLRNFKVPSLT